ncbi:glycosyltransferase [Halomarina litorea]|uniref:glycosyltransferase n=1 Tax=Halomarina litorea TaxID=2961595 RepID=UPI0020C2AFB4|nr:glycosyltransferase [Halomarina sp. BCD28]
MARNIDDAENADGGSGLPFSVVLPVYRGDDARNFNTAVESLRTQTETPTEVVVIADGPLTRSLENSLKRWCEEFPAEFRVDWIPKNRGLGNALRTGVRECSHDLVARMDADDISVSDRFERQLEYLSDNPTVDVIGGQLAEFGTNPDKVTSLRRVPLRHEEIATMARSRSPMNHATVMFRREAVLAAGNYRPVEPMEDYDLWVRMLIDGAKFANLPDVLLKMRAGDGLYERRSGLEYGREELRRQTDFLRWGFIGPFRFCLNLLLRLPVRFVPGRVRGYIYERLFRDTPTPT